MRSKTYACIVSNGPAFETQLRTVASSQIYFSEIYLTSAGFQTVLENYHKAQIRYKRPRLQDHRQFETKLTPNSGLIMFEDLKEWRQHMAKKRMTRFDDRYIILAGDTLHGTRYLERNTEIQFFTGESKDDKVWYRFDDLYFAYNLKNFTQEFYKKRARELGVKMMPIAHKERLILFMTGKISNNDFLGEIELLKPLPDALGSSKVLAVEASGSARKVESCSLQDAAAKLERKLSLEGSPLHWKKEKKHLGASFSDDEVEFVWEDAGFARKRMGNAMGAASQSRTLARSAPAQLSFSLKKVAENIADCP